MIATFLTWPTSADRSCRVRTTSLVSTDPACAPQVRHASALFILEYFYFFQHFPNLLLPPSGPSIGQLRGIFEWIEIVVQSVGLIVELPWRPKAHTREDVDLEDSRTGTTRRTLGTSETMCEKVACLYGWIECHHNSHSP